MIGMALETIGLIVNLFGWGSFAALIGKFWIPFWLRNAFSWPEAVSSGLPPPPFLDDCTIKGFFATSTSLVFEDGRYPEETYLR